LFIDAAGEPAGFVDRVGLDCGDFFGVAFDALQKLQGAHVPMRSRPLRLPDKTGPSGAGDQELAIAVDTVDGLFGGCTTIAKWVPMLETDLAARESQILMEPSSAAEKKT
jgi:hypothetical protein